jgi:hypothetical protein
VNGLKPVLVVSEPTARLPKQKSPHKTPPLAGFYFDTVSTSRYYVSKKETTMKELKQIRGGVFIVLLMIVVLLSPVFDGIASKKIHRAVGMLCIAALFAGWIYFIEGCRAVWRKYVGQSKN